LIFNFYMQTHQKVVVKWSQIYKMNLMPKFDGEKKTQKLIFKEKYVNRKPPATVRNHPHICKPYPHKPQTALRAVVGWLFPKPHRCGLVKTEPQTAQNRSASTPTTTTSTSANTLRRSTHHHFRSLRQPPEPPLLLTLPTIATPIPHDPDRHNLHSH